MDVRTGQYNVISTLLDCTIVDMKVNGKRASGTFVKEASRANVNCKFQITVDSQWDDLPVLIEIFELPEAGNLKKVGRMVARTETSWKKVDVEYFPVKFDGQHWEGDLESSNETSLQWRPLKKSAKSPTPEFFQSMSNRKSDDELIAFLEDTFTDKAK